MATVAEVQEAITLVCNTLKNENQTSKSDLKFLKSIGFSKIKNKIIDELNHYINKYPLLKIIDKSSLSSVLEKYDLVLGKSSLFIERIPNLNIKEIMYSLSLITLENKFDSIDVYKKKLNSAKWIERIVDEELQELYLTNFKFNGEVYENSTYILKPNFKNIHIAAPIGFFKLKGEKIKNRQIIEDDPIVVIEITENIFAILTAWGLESSDNLIINHSKN